MSNSLINSDDILAVLAASGTPQSKREIVKQLNISGSRARTQLKELLRDMLEDGTITKASSGGYAIPGSLPSVGTVEVTEIDTDGDLIGRPLNWDEETQGPAPRVEIRPAKKGHPALAPGDRVLARFKRLKDGTYDANVMRRLDVPQGKVTGVVRNLGSLFVLEPADKKAKRDFDIPRTELNGAKDGDVVVAEIQPTKRSMGKKKVRVTEVIGKENDPKTISLISLHEMGLRTEFSHAALAEAEQMGIPDLKGREDLRRIPLVTIDGADARDFDDAVFAEKTENGYHLIVAIADVAHYVRPGSALDDEAQHRGNSTYFPDRVIPMLPEKLSNDLCSLRPKENRACMAVHLYIDNHGRLQNYKFVRGLMKSAARLTYEQVQAAREGITDDTTGPLMKDVIEPLYEAYETLWKSREKRGALDLDLPERQIIINDQNEMTGVKLRERLDSHKLIEEFMVLANVAAATALEKDGEKAMYRCHEKPDAMKLDDARQFIEAFGLSMPKGQVMRPAQINEVLKQAESTPYSHIISEVILRSQTQARYETGNKGHFGLALQRYTHFTSPIRRYSDLEVHRCLIEIFNLGAGGMTDKRRLQLDDIAEHISGTERKSMEAERNAVDRFTSAYLSQHIGAEFEGRIRGVTRFGLFIELDETGADGFLPMRALPNDRYDHHEDQHALIGRKSKRVYRLGARISVKLAEANAMSGSTILHPVDDRGADIPGFKMQATPYDGRKNNNPHGGKYKNKGHGGKRRQKGYRNKRGGKPGGFKR